MAGIRGSISKGMRFDILTRDNFTCRYRGRSAPAVVLQVDHAVPVAADGETTAENLVTACVDCNLSKAAKLVAVPDLAGALAEDLDDLGRNWRLGAYLQRDGQEQLALADALGMYWRLREGGDFAGDCPPLVKTALLMFLQVLDSRDIRLAIAQVFDRMPARSFDRLDYLVKLCWALHASR
jgi:hypothetical protein